MPFIRIVVTVAMVAVCAVLVSLLWDRYMLSPWTRDGRVRAEVVDVAPEISGPIVDVPVQENQLVHQGDVLFSIDQSRFKIALAQAQAAADAAHEETAHRVSDSNRRLGLTGVVSPEEQERFKSAAAVANAQYLSALASLDLAKLNLDRSAVKAPTTGYVTNLRIRVGDFANAGVARVAMVDSNSYWVSGYFEETKLGKIHVGDAARITLMGRDQPLKGHVESVARGINEQNAAPDRAGLQEVNPVFAWVRLAQRIPVRIHIDSVPEGLDLVAGTTCTIAIGEDALPRNTLFGRLGRWLKAQA